MRILILLFSLISPAAFATTITQPLIIGPIGLNGFGTLSAPDYGAWGGEGLSGVGLSLHASGSNGTDNVSIDTWGSIEIFFGNIPAPSIGETLALSMPNRSSCTVPWFASYMDTCGISIDGITGYGVFSGIGGDGLLQVFSDAFHTNLLAQAQIANTVIQVTNVSVNPDIPSHWTANFSVVDPPATVPEPRGLIPLGVGLISLLPFKARSKP